MPTTITGLPNGALPLSGAERLPVDSADASTTNDISTGDVAALAELLTGAHLNIGPERIDPTAVHFTTQGAGDPVTVWFPPGSIPVLAGYGPVAAATGAFDLYTRRVIPASPTRIWEVEAEVEQVSVFGGESPVARVGLRSLKSDFTDTSGAPLSWATASAVLTAGQIIVLTARFAATAPPGGFAWANPATAVLFRPVVEINERSDLAGSSPNSVARVRRLLVRDVTDLAPATASDVRAGTDATKPVPAAALMASAAFQVLIDAGPVAWNTALGYNAIVTITAARLIGAPSGLFDGQTYTLDVKEGGAGGFNPTWNAIWDFGAAGAPPMAGLATGKKVKVVAQYSADSGLLEANYRMPA
jgi:hypothetical protein